MCAGGEAEPRRARGKVYAGMDELRYGKEDREDEAEGPIKDYFVLCLNMVKF